MVAEVSSFRSKPHNAQLAESARVSQARQMIRGPAVLRAGCPLAIERAGHAETFALVMATSVRCHQPSCLPHHCGVPRSRNLALRSYRLLHAAGTHASPCLRPSRARAALAAPQTPHACTLLNWGATSMSAAAKL